MKREELKRYTSSEIEEIDNALLEKSEDGTIKMTRVYIASEADKVMESYEKRIKELYEATCKDCPKLKELESMNANINNRCIKMEGVMRLLQEESARLKKQVPVWHKLDKPLYVDENGNDVWDLPNEDESHNDEVYTLHKCGCYGTEQWDEIDPEVIAMWCELPTAPSTTDESSATEKEKKEIRHQKYKRCLAMAEWCDAEADVADADGDYEDMRWYQKWHERWLEFADKFTEKENG